MKFQPPPNEELTAAHFYQGRIKAIFDELADDCLLRTARNPALSKTLTAGCSNDIERVETVREFTAVLMSAGLAGWL